MQTNINLLLDAIADHFGCRCEFERDGKTVILQTISPAGGDVYQEFTLDGKPENHAQEVAKQLSENAENFDPDEEAALWIGSDGHGKNGAPYRLRDLLDDMDWTKQFYTDVALFASDWIKDMDK